MALAHHLLASTTEVSKRYRLWLLRRAHHEFPLVPEGRKPELGPALHLREEVQSHGAIGKSYQSVARLEFPLKSTTRQSACNDDQDRTKLRLHDHSIAW